MKKNLLKIFALIFCLGFFLTGCASLADVRDGEGNAIKFDSPVYFQGQVAKIGNYLYYGNAYSDITAENYDYNGQTKSSYLARVNLSDLAFKDGVLNDNKKHTAPINTEKVITDRVAGYVNQEMYAYGEYLYFTSANIHKTNTMLNDYSMVSFFRVKFNGTGLQELGTFTYDENSTITLEQGSDDNYYFVIICPTDVEKTEEESESAITYDAYSMKIGQKVEKAEKLIGEVTSAVVAEDKVVYSFNTTSDRLTCAVNGVDFATNDVTEYDTGNSKEIKLIDSDENIIFYSYEHEVYYKDLTNGGTFTPAFNQLFYSAPTISNLHKMDEGYVFEGTSALMYKSSLTGAINKVTAKTSDDEEKTSIYSDILFVDGDYIYLSNESSIKKVSKFGDAPETIVEMTIKSGEFGYADGYIYFYANAGDLVDEKGEKVEGEVDNTFYLYQTDKLGNLQRLGQAK